MTEGSPFPVAGWVGGGALVFIACPVFRRQDGSIRKYIYISNPYVEGGKFLNVSQISNFSNTRGLVISSPPPPPPAWSIWVVWCFAGCLVISQEKSKIVLLEKKWRNKNSLRGEAKIHFSQRYNFFSYSFLEYARSFHIAGRRPPWALGFSLLDPFFIQ